MAEIYTPEGFFVTTLSQDLNASSTTINLTAVPSTATKGYMVLEPASATKREVIHFTSAGVSTVTAADDTTDGADASGRGCSGSINAGANTTHAQGATVLIAAVDQYWERLISNMGVIVNSSGAPDLNGVELIIDADADTSMTADTDDQIDWKLGGSDRFRMGVSDFDLVTATANILVAGADPKRGLYIDGASMYARTTSGATTNSTETTTNKIMKRGWAFDKDADEFVQFKIPAPKYWDLGTLTATPHWTADAGTAGTVAFAIQVLALSNDDAIDTAFGTAQTSTDTFIATGDEHIGPTTSAITVGNTPAKGDMLVFQIFRDISEDTFDADAILLGLEISFSIGQYNDI